MAKSLNTCTLLGRLGKDAEVRFTPNGASVTSFSIATDRSWKDQSGEWKTETTWTNVVAWRMENVAQYLTKGAQVCVTGRLQTRSYEDKNGDKRWVTEVVADNVVLCGGRAEGESTGQRGGRGNDFEPGITDDSVPF